MTEMQAALFDGIREKRTFHRKPKAPAIQDRFELWIQQNPQALSLFIKYANEARESGRKHYSIKAIIERVRWHVAIQTRGDDFKINDHWSSRLARLLMQKDPRLEGFFELRKLRA